jgi:hypothetical protein
MAGALAPIRWACSTARIQSSDADNPLVQFDLWAIGARRRKTDMTLFYMSAYGADANSVAYVAGYVIAAAGIFLFPQIDSILLRLASAAVKGVSNLGY